MNAGVDVARFDRAGVERYLNDSVMFTGPTPANNGRGQVWTDPLGNTVRTMDGVRDSAASFNDWERIVFNGPIPNTGAIPKNGKEPKAPALDPLTWKPPQPPKNFSDESPGMSKKDYVQDRSHIYFEGE